MNCILEEEGFEARSFNGLQLAFEDGIEGVTARNIARTIRYVIPWTIKDV